MTTARKSNDVPDAPVSVIEVPLDAVMSLCGLLWSEAVDDASRRFGKITQTVNSFWAPPGKAWLRCGDAGSLRGRCVLWSQGRADEASA